MFQNSINCNAEECVSLQDTARDEALECITVGVLTVVSEDSPHEGQSSVDLHPISTAIILEGGIVMDHIKNLPQAVCLLFGLTYALHLDYPKCMANTLNFIQTVMLGLGKKKLPPKLLTLKNSLLGQNIKEPSSVRQHFVSFAAINVLLLSEKV